MRRFSFSAALIGLTGLPLAAVAASPAATTKAVPITKAAPEGGPAAASIPLAPAVLGPRPRLNPKVEPSAATKLSPGISDLTAPNSLALPTKPEMVRIQQLRPLSLAEILTISLRDRMRAKQVPRKFH